MVKRGSTTFSATKVAKAGLTATAALQKIMDLEKDVSKLRHHVSVLSKRNHGLQKEVERLKKEEVAVVSEVASPDRVEEPEPLVVVEPEEMVEVDMAVAFVASAGVAGVRVASEARQEVAEPRVALEVDVEGGPSAVGYAVSEGKRRRVDNSDEEEEVRTSLPRVPLGPAAMVPVGPRMYSGRGGFPDRYWLVGARRREELRVVREEILNGGGRGRVAGVRNGMEGDSFRTRGSYARAGRGGDVVVRRENFVPYRRWR